MRQAPSPPPPTPLLVCGPQRPACANLSGCPLDYCAPPSEFALIRCFRIAEGLNTITRRGEIGTSLPVFGLRPMRCPFLRTTNEPNDESFTVSPRSRQSVISFSTISTRVADSVRDSPTFWYTASHRSARVTVLPAIASSPLSATTLST